MTPYYSTDAAVADLQMSARSWLGTPFMPNASVKGAGVSCQKLAAALFIESGFWPAGTTVPDAAMNWSHAQTDSILSAFAAGRSDLEELSGVATPQPGDLVGFKIGGCVHHCGVVIDDQGSFVHCLRGRGVQMSSLRDATFMTRIEKIWRPMK